MDGCSFEEMACKFAPSVAWLPWYHITTLCNFMVEENSEFENICWFWFFSRWVISGRFVGMSQLLTGTHTDGREFFVLFLSFFLFWLLHMCWRTSSNGRGSYLEEVHGSFGEGEVGCRNLGG